MEPASATILGFFGLRAAMQVRQTGFGQKRTFNRAAEMRSKMTFEEDFKAWLMASASTAIPASVRAFSFNLCELDDDRSPFGVELTGSSEFDVEDADWACDEVWEATPRMLEIPVAFSSRSWEECLAEVKRLVIAAIDENGAGEVLKTREGVAVGFVDGDLDLVWHR